MIQKLQSFKSDDSLGVFICSTDYYGIDLSTSCLLDEESAKCDRAGKSSTTAYREIDIYIMKQLLAEGANGKVENNLLLKVFFPVVSRFAENFFEIKYSKLVFAVM